MLAINDRIRVGEDELTWSFARSGGPGGQNVNKVASKVVLRWRLDDAPGVAEDVKSRLRVVCGSRITLDGDLLIVSQRFRDQERNRRDCLQKLREFLERASAPPKARKKSRPTRGSRERRLAAKRIRAVTKENRRGQTGD